MATEHAQAAARAEFAVAMTLSGAALRSYLSPRPAVLDLIDHACDRATGATCWAPFRRWYRANEDVIADANLCHEW
jgi:hypothetical protein